MGPTFREIKINLSIEAAQTMLLVNLSELAIDPLPIYGFDDLLVERGIDLEAAYGCKALVNSELPSALDDLSRPLNTVTVALSDVVASAPTVKLVRSSAAVRHALSLLTKIDNLAQALLTAERDLAAASPDELTHPIGMRLMAASGWGQTIVEHIWYTLPDYSMTKQMVDTNPPCDLKTLKRATTAWRGCLNPSDLFAVAATQAALNGKWPYTGRGQL